MNRNWRGTDEQDTEGPRSWFASADRSTPALLDAQIAVSAEHPVVRAILESACGHVLVLNEHRQILSANGEVLAALSPSSRDCYVGLRPGELLGCIHVDGSPSGCGTGKMCRHCGAVLAILASQSQQRSASGECQLVSNIAGALETRDYRARATTFELRSHALTVLVLIDVTSAKRMETLERVFFHDLSNVVQGLLGVEELMQSDDPSELAEAIADLSRRIKEEVLAHGLLLDAERGNLGLLEESRPASAVLSCLSRALQHHPAARGKHLQFVLSANQPVCCDHRLLNRVLTNMIINALEATAPEGTVRVWYDQTDVHAFRVHNEGQIPDSIASQIFLRSFSTKQGKGRGLGTWSMKLLGERYLGGKVLFRSDPTKGTVFWVELPLRLPQSSHTSQPPSKAQP